MTEPSLANTIAKETGRVLRAAVAGVFDWKSIAVVGATLCMIVFLIPVDRRASPEVLELVRGFANSSLLMIVGWSGWLVAVLVSIISFIWISVLKAANLKLGEVVSGKRSDRDPDRLSTVNEDVDNYRREKLREPDRGGIDD